MSNDAKVGLGLVAAVAVCCGGPVIFAVLASGALLGAVGALWASGRLLLLGGSAVLIVVAVWLLARRFASSAHADADSCAVPAPRPSMGHPNNADVHAHSVRRQTAAVSGNDRPASN